MPTRDHDNAETHAADIAPLLRFLNESPTPFHAVANIAARLRDAGYAETDEGADFKAAPGKYFFIRDGSLIAAQFSGSPQTRGFRLVGAHTDSPCLKLKPNALAAGHGYAKLAPEVYGGALLAPWFDRGLGLAGRVTLNADGAMTGRLINIARPIAFIPSLAIHLDRGVNESRSINKQKELPAILCRAGEGPDFPDFNELLREQLSREHPRLKVEKILAFDLCLYDCQPAEVVGLKREFIASARLDNLLSCYAAVEALLASQDTGEKNNNIIALNDHEEVGSVSAGGADGPFLQSVLRRLCGGGDNLARALRHSMLVSADNAHGVHPNYPDKHEPAHRPLLNAGPVIKINSNQRYATSGETAGWFRRVCERAGIPCQSIVTRSDMGCGSTIGPITAAKLGVRTADIGVAQLGMHSARELAGAHDQKMLADALREFFGGEEWPF